MKEERYFFASTEHSILGLTKKSDDDCRIEIKT